MSSVTSRNPGAAARLGAALVVLASCAAGCTSDNPALCETNADCLRAVAAGEIPQTHQLCHPEDNICYAGCTIDADCQDPAFQPGLRCVDRHCVRPGSEPDAGSDAGPDGTADGDAPGSDGSLPDLGSPPDGADSGLPNGQECGGPEVCASGQCVDGICCAQLCDGLCEACNVAGFLGQCAALPKGQGAEECRPDDPACGGACDGERACSFDTDAVCNEQCNPRAREGAGEVSRFVCQADGTCGGTADPARAKLCEFSLCTQENNSAPDCPVTCEGHDKCIADSLCDRIEAHLTGQGTCVDPKRIAADVDLRTATDDETLDQLIAVALAQDRPYVRVGPPSRGIGAYIEPRKHDKEKPLVLVGMDGADATVFDPATQSHAFDVSNKASLTLQGVTVTGAAGKDKHGINCVGSSSAVTLVESMLGGNNGLGLQSTSCTVTVRRSTIDGNRSGGLNVEGGTAVVTNSVIRNNGTDASSSVSGVRLEGVSAVTFINNTVVSNPAADGVAGGVLCKDTTATLKNSIFANNGQNTLGHQVQGCEAIASVEEDTRAEACGLDPDQRPTTAPCIDGGDNSAVEALRLDGANAPRVQGDKVDIGAFEVQ